MACALLPPLLLTFDKTLKCVRVSTWFKIKNDGVCTITLTTQPLILSSDMYFHVNNFQVNNWIFNFAIDHTIHNYVFRAARQFDKKMNVKNNDICTTTFTTTTKNVRGDYNVHATLILQNYNWTKMRLTIHTCLVLHYNSINNTFGITMDRKNVYG